MKFQTLEEKGRGMSEAEVGASLRSLCNDPRFAAVVAIVQRHREQFVDGGAVQSLANNHGALAHNGGSVYALNCLLGAIKQVSDAPKRRGEAKPETEPES